MGDANAGPRRKTVDREAGFAPGPEYRRKFNARARHARRMRSGAMSLPFDVPAENDFASRSLESAFADLAGKGDFGSSSHDPRALRILAKTIYRELRQSGLAAEDVMSVAGELLGLVTGDVQLRRGAPHPR
jgi:hypothetical protein